MDEEDDVFLKIFNQKRDAGSRCTEDQFEEVMSFFELTSRKEQPYAFVDNSPLMSFEEFQQAMDPAVEESVKRFAKDIYEYWKSRRTSNGNEPLLPTPKVSPLANCSHEVWQCRSANRLPQVEAGRDTDDTDPYVCFRRREVRQTRKTRGRDAQSADKLRRLRKELEDARQMVALVRQRELARKEMLAIERQVFLQRSEVKEMKRKLNIKDDDEDLINQKVSPMQSRDRLLHMLMTATAEEEASRSTSCATPGRASTAHAPQGWYTSCRRLTAVGGCSGREGERDSARYQAEYRQAHQVERGLCGFHKSTSLPVARANIRCCFFPPCNHHSTAHATIIGIVR